MEHGQMISWIDSTDNLLYQSSIKKREANGVINPSHYAQNNNEPVNTSTSNNRHDFDNASTHQGMRHRNHHHSESNESDVAAGLKSFEVRDGGADNDESSRYSSSRRVLVLGIDISRFTRTVQFILCASGVFAFTLVYGYLQELISIQLFNRQMGLFIAFFQFFGYSVWSTILRVFVHKRGITTKLQLKSHNSRSTTAVDSTLKMYIGISLLRAFDLAMTNMAMQYINYPAKTLMKSSKTLWTMLFGLIIVKKRYKQSDYAAVLLMVVGLFMFLHADATSAAVFEPLGVIMLIASLISDGAISNLSETLMSKYSICQDEYIFYIYSLSTIAIFVSAQVKGDFFRGLQFLSVAGTMEEIESGGSPTWSPRGKIIVMILFSTFGFFGSSCSAAITKNFGALTMSITSTARKAMTLFFSFLLFPNHCTLEHVCGIVLFLSSLLMKAIVEGRSTRQKHSKSSRRYDTVHIV